MAWAACEEEADVAERAQKRLSATQSALNEAAQRSSKKADEDRRVVRDRDDIEGKRSILENDPDYVLAQQEKMNAWKAWREAKQALEICGQKKRDDSWR